VTHSRRATSAGRQGFAGGEDRSGSAAQDPHPAGDLAGPPRRQRPRAITPRNDPEARPDRHPPRGSEPGRHTGEPGSGPQRTPRVRNALPTARIQLLPGPDSRPGHHGPTPASSGRPSPRGRRREPQGAERPAIASRARARRVALRRFQNGSFQCRGRSGPAAGRPWAPLCGMTGSTIASGSSFRSTARSSLRSR